MKTKLVLIVLSGIFCSTVYAEEFSDLPKTHWSYSAVQYATDTGILQGYAGKFYGEKLINRYQMAVIIEKVLDVTSKNQGSSSSMSVNDMRNMERLMIEFADEIALLNVRISTLENYVSKLRR